MTNVKFFPAAFTLFVCSLPAVAQYSAEQEGDLVHLEDAKNHTLVSVITSVGNVAYEMKVNGTNVLYFPSAIEDFRQRGGLAGIPLQAPWANRLDEPAFYANGKRYAFNSEIGTVRAGNPSAGFLTSARQWQVVEVKADANEAWVTSRLDYYKHPEWMVEFPFAQTYEMTYRLHDGTLEVHLKIQSLSTDPLPVSIGFHPIYRLTDSPREDWTINVAAKTQWVLSPAKIPTGVTQPIEQFFPDPRNAPLKDYVLDHVFSDLIRDGSGRAVMSVKGKNQKLDLMYGPKFQATVIWSPGSNTFASSIPPERGGAVPPPLGQVAGPVAAGGGGRAGAQGAGGGRGGPGRGGGRTDPNFIAFEPMAGITDAMNLAQKGLYKELQYIAPGGVWEESFWVRPTGFEPAGHQ
jgi:aldose 1-epimerase